ncbi:four-carbon acid sugar kinase family protein [Acuticoccus sp. I52.16.1]|uniref:four-carbon acid sugar kinase family protein n=1 Tax=Acuticoccus sp. I52.16.1 TaxID=2928472 RepID=UPI001FD03B27|nr:four-carbon acid sugar kinase family protein [Acuticoccus sp. I52.16.1]UOM36588.1 four-carbon acid sugar kinase family protein [Acuticoccus sp. I52.16.1]
MSPLPTDRPLLAWYGDDFTGASGVLEAMTFGGVGAVLFLGLPTADQLARFAGYGAVGIAGIARSQSPAWMDRELPPVFRFLEGLGAAITQYKVCSTFDSSPTVGSIGHAYDLAAPILAGRWTPMLVAAPGNSRFQVFGNLFASVGATGYRIDRHPTMSRHPVTPMTEADLGRHLARQTDAEIGLVDIVAMRRGTAGEALARELERGARIVSLDVIDPETLAEAGRLVWETRGQRLFAIASQGLNYALLAHWYAAGLLAEPAAPPVMPRAARIACVSGSCSPVTADQIAWAETNGFRAIRLDVAPAAVGGRPWQAALAAAADSAAAAASEGADPLVFTARGPDDGAVAALNAAIAVAGADTGAVNALIGQGLGRLLADVLARTGARRGIIAGGDTSSHATTELGVYALTALAPTDTPGAALFRAHADAPEADGLEVALKGGQMGSPDYFGRMRGGA